MFKNRFYIHITGKGNSGEVEKVHSKVRGNTHALVDVLIHELACVVMNSLKVGVTAEQAADQIRDLVLMEMREEPEDAE